MNMSGLSGLGNSFLADLRGTVMHCVQYGTGKKKKIICSKFGKGAGSPNAAARKRAGVKGKFRERTKRTAGKKHTVRQRLLKPGKPRTPGAKKRCMKFYKSGPKKGKCAAFRPTAKALKSGRTAQEGRVCERFYKKGKRKGKCAKFKVRGTKSAPRRAGKKKSAKRKPAAKKKAAKKRKAGAKKGSAAAKKKATAAKKKATKAKKKATKAKKAATKATKAAKKAAKKAKPKKGKAPKKKGKKKGKKK
jgi:hypothetical protein